jgi:methyl-accepting chemotaxis protein
MLGLAQDFAARCTQQLESWISKKEISADKLFANLYYPVQKTDPPKFTTDWDQLSDRDILAIEESVLSRSSSIVFAVLVDNQGYLPTHNVRFSLPLTGNAAADLVSNRTKRLVNDRTGFAAARNEAPFLIQRYQQDTGDTFIDLSVPVYIKGQHWGAVRIGYRISEGR